MRGRFVPSPSDRKQIPANSRVPFLQPQGPVHKPDVSARSKWNNITNLSFEVGNGSV